MYDTLPSIFPEGYECKVQYVPIAADSAADQARQTTMREPQTLPSNRRTPADLEMEQLDWMNKYSNRPNVSSSARSSQAYVQLADVLRDHFGIVPKRKMAGYVQPYPEHYDNTLLPPKYKVPYFTKFSS